MNNYTPIDVAKMKGLDSRRGFDVNILFLILILITLIILAGLLFVLINQRVQELSFAARSLA